MASSRELVDYIVEQLQGAGQIYAKRMFGEYGLFCDGMFFAVVCDDQLFFKLTPETVQAFPDLPQAPPYPGAKAYLLMENIDDWEQMTALAHMTCAALRKQPARRKRR